MDDVQIIAAENYLRAKRWKMKPTIIYHYKLTYNYLYFIYSRMRK